LRAPSSALLFLSFRAASAQAVQREKKKGVVGKKKGGERRGAAGFTDYHYFRFLHMRVRGYRKKREKKKEKREYTVFAWGRKKREERGGGERIATPPRLGTVNVKHEGKKKGKGSKKPRGKGGRGRLSCPFCLARRKEEKEEYVAEGGERGRKKNTAAHAGSLRPHIVTGAGGRGKKKRMWFIEGGRRRADCIAALFLSWGLHEVPGEKKKGGEKRRKEGWGGKGRRRGNGTTHTVFCSLLSLREA